MDRIHELTKIDRWFLEKLLHIYRINDRLRAAGGALEPALMREAKVYGFTDFQIARALGMEKKTDIEEAMLQVRARRKEMGIEPCVKQIDTLAAEYPAQTNYLYLTYSGTSGDID